jgi:hypothetical protein
MDAVVRFFADHVGLPLRFSSPEWSEFDTGSTTLALHVASPEKPAGTCGIEFGVADVDAPYAKCTAAGVVATSPPADLHGHQIAGLRDMDGAEFSVSR